MTSNEPRVWLGCLACYNSGHLVGEWMSPEDAAGATVQDVHDKGGYIVTASNAYDGPHEELWVTDSEYVPLSGEFGQSICRTIADAYAEVGGDLWGAYLAYARSGLGSADGDEISPVSDFEEAYSGEYDSREDFAYDLADGVCLFDGLDDDSVAVRYFDWAMWTRDLFLGGDYGDEPAPGGIYVFRNL